MERYKMEEKPKYKKPRCPHDKIKAICKLCGGGSICPHQTRKADCKICGGSSICVEHNKKNPVARIAEGPQFANTTKDVQFVYNVEVNLFANIVVSNQFARNATAHLFANTKNYVQIVKHVRGHLFVFTKKTKDYVNHVGVLDYVKPNIVKQKLQKNIMDIVCLVVSKCVLK